MKKAAILVFVISVILISCGDNKYKVKETVNNTLDFMVSQSMALYRDVKDMSDRFPRTINEDGKLITSNDKSWTSGFFPGTLWYMYEYTGADPIKNAALEMSSRLINQQYTTDNHDVGFIINCSYGNGYRLTENEDYKQIIINAAKSLSTRYSAVTGCIRSWDKRSWEYPVIIDNMMNLELLCRATEFSGDSSFYKIAVSHADTTMKYHFRADGSSYHVVSYDTIHGGCKEKVTHQGYSNESAWSRGQAWALYGYTMMYRETGKEEYLNQAIKVANFIADHPNMPTDKIPYWDFNAPGIPDEPRDVSAATVMASALIELSGYTTRDLSNKFLGLAEQQLISLSSPEYLAATGTNGNFTLKKSVGFLAKNSEVNVPLTYADYYFAEALMRYKNLKPKDTVSNDREIWITTLTRIADPVLVNLSENTLRKNMPVEVPPEGKSRNREEVSHLEAVGRLICGIAPWLELGADDTPEGQLREKYINLCLTGIKNGLSPESPDVLNFTTDRQALVDAAFLAQGFLRAPNQLWNRLDETTKERVIEAFKSTRQFEPLNSNWLLFTAMIEAFLLEFTGECNEKAITHAIDSFNEWYKGDSWYGDGPKMHFDYYNSLVIHPMLIDILEKLPTSNSNSSIDFEKQMKRAVRHADQLERMISPEGTFPAVGRSITYRFGAFHLLSQIALMEELPPHISSAQVRCALTAVIKRQLNVESTFDNNEWLTLGFCGHQPELAESYISTGSLYLCTSVFLPLGLPAENKFWSDPYTDWSSKKIWKGEETKRDKALKD